MPPRPMPAVARPLAAVALAVASLVAAAAVGSVFLTTASDSWAAISAPGPAVPADGILLVVAMGGAALTLWLGLGTALAALSALPGALGRACSALAARIAPVAVRKVVAFVLGTALTAALVPGTALARTDEAPATVTSNQQAVASARQRAAPVADLADAAPDASFRFVSDSVSNGDVAPSPSWSAQAPSSSGRPYSRAPIALVSPGGGPVRTPAKDAQAAEAEAVVVLRGDSLWSIAARHLGAKATDAEISAEWPRWFAANRPVIGDDPAIISPGQRLSPPAPVQDIR